MNPPWSSDSTVPTDLTLQQLAPYIGRMKTAIAQALITGWSREGDLVVDPFCGSGVLALEAAARGRRVTVGDWNPYAIVLTRAKLFPPVSLSAAKRRLKRTWELAADEYSEQDLESVPMWVREFFHPDTLQSALAFRDACIERRDWFLLACLLGILHHQRPGFLSFPSSHLVPYLRDRNFPRAEYPEMYEFREVLPRLEAKIERVFKRPTAGYGEKRRIFKGDARYFPRVRGIQAVITSPPYMNELDYVRDNRLRLWFIDRDLPKGCVQKETNRQEAYVNLIRDVSTRLATCLNDGGHFVMVVGEVTRGRARAACTATLTRQLFSAEPALARCFRLVSTIYDNIPDIRRSRRECSGTRRETVLVYKKKI